MKIPCSIWFWISALGNVILLGVLSVKFLERDELSEMNLIVVDSIQRSGVKDSISMLSVREVVLSNKGQTLFVFDSSAEHIFRLGTQIKSTVWDYDLDYEGDTLFRVENGVEIARREYASADLSRFSNLLPGKVINGLKDRSYMVMEGLVQNPSEFSPSLRVFFFPNTDDSVGLALVSLRRR